MNGKICGRTPIAGYSVATDCSNLHIEILIAQINGRFVYIDKGRTGDEMACLYGVGKDWGSEGLLVWGREGLGKRRLACMGKGRTGEEKASMYGEGKDWGREGLLVWGREGMGKRRLACTGKGSIKMVGMI